MTAVIRTIPLPARTVHTKRGKSKYDLAALVPGSEQCISEEGVINPDKAQSRLSSAVSSFKKRPGNESARFTIRRYLNAEGQDCVGCWRLADKVAAEEVL